MLFTTWQLYMLFTMLLKMYWKPGEDPCVLVIYCSLYDICWKLTCMYHVTVCLLTVSEVMVTRQVIHCCHLMDQCLQVCCGY